MQVVSYDMEKYKYSVTLDNGIVFIEDLIGELSVTIAYESVLKEVEVQYGSLVGKIVVWRDTEGVWDAFTRDENGNVGIRAIGTLTINSTIEKIKDMPFMKRSQLIFR